MMAAWTLLVTGSWTPARIDTNRVSVKVPNPDNRQHSQNDDDHEENVSLRMIWLILAGWWLSAIWVGLAWVLLLVVPASPLGMRMLAHLHRIVALKAPEDESLDLVEDTLQRMESSTVSQYPTAVRLLYTLIIGWWFSIIWSAVAWIRSLSIQTRPMAVVMFTRTPSVMTLRRY